MSGQTSTTPCATAQGVPGTNAITHEASNWQFGIHERTRFELNIAALGDYGRVPVIQRGRFAPRPLLAVHRERALGRERWVRSVAPSLVAIADRDESRHSGRPPVPELRRIPHRCRAAGTTATSSPDPTAKSG